MTKLHPAVGSMVKELTSLMDDAMVAAGQGDFSKLQELAKNSGNDSTFWEMVPSYISKGIRTAELIAKLDPNNRLAVHEACSAVRDSLTQLGIEAMNAQ